VNAFPDADNVIREYDDGNQRWGSWTRRPVRSDDETTYRFLDVNGMKIPRREAAWNVLELERIKVAVRLKQCDHISHYVECSGLRIFGRKRFSS